MTYEPRQQGFDLNPVHNVNDFAVAAVPVSHRAKAGATSRRSVLASRGSVIRALALASLCGLAAISAPAVNVASNLKVSLNGDKVVLTWSGAPGVVYQVQGATSLGQSANWQNIDVPTTGSSVTSIRTSPAEFYRVGIFTNMDPFSTYARGSGSLLPDTAPPTVPTGLTGSAPNSGQVNLSWNASTDQSTVTTSGSGHNITYTTNTSGLNGYNIYRGGIFLKQVLAPATSTSDTSVNPSTTYSYFVKAIDKAGYISASSSPVNVTTPAAVIVNYSLSPSSASYAASGGSGSISVTGGSGSWSVSNPNTSWITITSGSSGSGNGTVYYTVSANTVTSQRSGNMTIAGQNFSVTQAAAAGGGGGGGSAPVGYWTFDTANMSGSTTAMDSSGSGNNATLQGTVLPTIVAGRTNQAVKLDGVSDLVSVPDSANLNIKGPFTVAAWVNFASVPNSGQYPNVVAKLNSPSSNYGYGLYWNGNGVAGIIGSGSPSWTTTSGAPAPAAGVWNHYVAVFDGANLKLYVNGVVSSQVAASAPADTAGIPVKMGLHYSNPATYGFINGTIDDARIYGRALSDTEITALASAGGGGSQTYYVISASPSPSTGGSAPGLGSVLSGTIATVNATAYAGYTFVNWTENGTQVSTSPSYSFAVTGNRSLAANFTQNPYTISTGSSPTAGGSTSGGGTKTSGSLVTVTAAASVGYSFVNWTENGGQVSTSPIYTFTASANRSLVANFSTVLTSYTVTTTSSPSTGGTTSGGGSKTAGSSVTVTAIANSGYTFSSWTENGNFVSSSASYSFTASANRNLTANFTSQQTTGPWTNTVSGTALHYGSATAVDGGGNILVVGTFQGSLDLGGTTLTSAGGSDMFLAKYTAAGALVWAKRFGSANGNEMPMSIAVDGSGNIAIGGRYYYAGNFGGATTFTCLGDADAFVAKYDSNGNHVWSLGFGSPESAATDYISSVAMDSQGNVIASGDIAAIYQETVNIGGINKTFWGGGDHIFLAKFTAAGSGGAGVASWIAHISQSAGISSKPCITVDRNDNIFLAASAGSIVLGGDEFGNGGTPYANTGFLSKWSSAGLFLLSRGSGTYAFPGTTSPGGVAVDSNGDVVVTGIFYSSTDLGNGTVSGGQGSAYVVKYSGSDFHFLWQARMTTPNLVLSDAQVVMNSIVIDANNNVVLAGDIFGPANFYDSSGVLRKSLGTAGSLDLDAFVVKYSTGGNLSWANQYGSSSGSDHGYGATISSGSPVVTGRFALGGLDSILMKLNP